VHVTATVEPRFTLEEALRILRDPTKDLSYLSTTRLGPVIREYLAWKKLSNAADRTLDQYERDLALLAVKCSSIDVATIGVENLMLVLDDIPRGSWKRYRAAWNGFFKWAIRHGHRSTINPLELLPELLRQNTPPVYRIYSATERAAIINASRQMDDPIRDRVRAHLLLDAGIRKGEARALLNSDVDPASRSIIVRGKGDKERVIAIRGPLWLAWEEHLLTPYPRLARLPELADHVFFPMRIAGAYGNRERQVTAAYPDRAMSERAFHEWHKRLVTHAEVPYRKPHMTRHTFATDALDATDGRDLYGVKELLGHSSTKITEVYLHSSKKRSESVAEKLAAQRRKGQED
jgi:site-specific recombinase XerD